MMKKRLNDALFYRDVSYVVYIPKIIQMTYLKG